MYDLTSDLFARSAVKLWVSPIRILGAALQSKYGLWTDSNIKPASHSEDSLE